jgi:hypothetical protein
MTEFKKLRAMLAIGFAAAVLLASMGIVLAQDIPKDKAVIVLPGGPFGKVTFEHKKHAESYGAKCETCHHPSKPEKPLERPNQACRDCHTRSVAAPMKTNLVAAYHRNATAVGGTCIDCHKLEKPKGKAVPEKCQDCHVK